MRRSEIDWPRPSSRWRRPGARVRWVATENLHLTVKFLGDVDDRVLADVCAAAEQAAAQVEPFEFVVAGLSAVPPQGLLRMIWAGVTEPSGRLQRLNELLEAAYAEMGFRVENRAFRPHLTLGRVKGSGGNDRIRAAAAEYAQSDFGTQGADRLIVFSSELGPGGPAYTPLAEAPLGGGPGA